MPKIEVETFVTIKVSAQFAWAICKEVEKMAKETPAENKGIQNLLEFREALMVKIALDKK